MKREKTFHINYLELKAAFLCLQYFCKGVTNEHIYLFMDNTVALKYISKMGGRKPLLNELAKQIWQWCENKNIWISAFHIPGSLTLCCFVVYSTRRLLYVFPCVILFLCFSVLLVLRLPRLGKRELILVLFVRLFGLCLFGFVCFLFLLGSGKGCGL